MSKENFTSALILAAGLGSRMKSALTKQKMTLGGRSVLLRATLAFEEAKSIDEIIVVAKEDELDFVHGELEQVSKLKCVVVGGATRFESAKRGFAAISEQSRYVAIHDAARCLVSPRLIDEVSLSAYNFGAASAVGLVNDTVKYVDGCAMITKTVKREDLRLAQTPQTFDVALYKKAISAVENLEITDDNMLLERIGIPVFAVVNEEHNFKITTKKDIEYAEFLIEKGYINE